MNIQTIVFWFISRRSLIGGY